MKTLLLLRHAKSSWKDASLADHARPLNKRGQRNAPQMGVWLRAKDCLPDYIVSSTAVRARDTAFLMAEAAQYVGPCLLLPQLYHATPEAILSVVQALPPEAQRVLLVGHNPGLEEFAARLTQQSVQLPTATLANLTLAVTTWAETKLNKVAKLQWVQIPKGL